MIKNFIAHTQDAQGENYSTNIFKGAYSFGTLSKNYLQFFLNKKIYWSLLLTYFLVYFYQ